MTTDVGVKRNLWTTRQSGLLAPKRMNFPIDSLELYLPLWHPGLSGSPIVSKDLNAYSGTVTGTTHNPPTHRFFDANDDKIVIPADNSINLGDKSFSVWGWLYPDGNGTAGRHPMFDKNDGAIANKSLTILTEGETKLVFSFFSDDLEPAVTSTYNNWYIIGATYNVSNKLQTVYFGSPTSVITSAGSRTASANLHTDTDNDAIELGRQGAANRFLGGRIGEVGLWVNKVLTLRELENIWYATRWRYM